MLMGCCTKVEAIGGRDLSAHDSGMGSEGPAPWSPCPTATDIRIDAPREGLTGSCTYTYEPITPSQVARAKRTYACMRALWWEEARPSYWPDGVPLGSQSYLVSGLPGNCEPCSWPLTLLPCKCGWTCGDTIMPGE